jgi:hypothetical protein
MTVLESYLVLIFAAVWLVPLAMAAWWEHRLKQLATQAGRLEAGEEPGS